MSNKNWINSYNKLNNSFEKKLVFRLGTDAGFFSEFNNMVLCIIYCLSRKIKFTLYSKSDNYSFGNSWTDFFVPFCQEIKNEVNSKVNLRPYQIKNDVFYKLNYIFYKKTSRVNYLVQDLWHYYHGDMNDFSKEVFNIPELGIEKKGLLDFSKIIIHNIWKYNLMSNEIVLNLKNKLDMPEVYLSMHIRSGDKLLEADLYGVHLYMDKIIDSNISKNIFVLTDDYSIVEHLKYNYSSYNFFTLCEPSERGYFHKEFIEMNFEKKYLQHLKLFTSIDICSSSKMFVGTYSSNPGMYMGMRIGESNCVCVDFDRWLIW